MRLPFTALTCLVLACGPDLTAATDTDPLVGVSEDPLLRSRGFGRSAMSRAPIEWRRHFVLEATSDVHLSVDVMRPSPGPHVAAFEVFAPSGSLYQRFDVPFGAGVAASDDVLTVRGGLQVWATLPVAGTWIQQFQMVGGWRVEVFLDQSPAPTDAFRFTLESAPQHTELPAESP